MRKLTKLLVFVLPIALITVALIITQTRVTAISRLLLYRITIPSAQRALCAAKRKIQPDFKTSGDAAVCNALGLSTILRANRQEIENPGPLAAPLNDRTPSSSETAAETVAKAHARLHLQERITLMASTLPEDSALVGANVFKRLATSSLGCIPAHDDLPGFTEDSAEQATSDLRFFLLQGFGLANVGVLESSSGLVLIDTTESAGNLIQALRQLWRTAFVRCRKKYILGALISHHHTDHVGGLKAITQYNLQVATELDDKAPPVAQVVAHESTLSLYTETFLQHPQAKYRRGLKQFGASQFLDLEPLGPHRRPDAPPGVISAGIGRSLGHIDGAGGVTFPTHQWSGSRTSLFLDGAEIELRLLPGETTDQTCFFVPGLSLLHVSDNFYFAFPNIYPLRGGVFRSPLDWISSLDTLGREYVPRIDAMSTGHTSPVFGRERVKELLRRYRDSIQFVHDQTIRLMNRLQDPDAIARGVADLFWTTFPKPDMQSIEAVLSDPSMPFYGQVHWAAKAVVFRERGWFGGTDVEINSHKLPQGQRYARMRDLASTSQPVSSAVLDALSKGDCQWALELTTMVLKADETAPEQADPGACLSFEDDDSVWFEARDMTNKTALELRQAYSDWRDRVCARRQTFHRSVADFDDPLRHGQAPGSFSKGSIGFKRRYQPPPQGQTSVEPVEQTCPALHEINSVTMSTLKARPLFLCLRREALWCLARRELPSSGRNWYLVEALTEREKSLEEISHLQVAHRIRQDFLQRVPDLPAVVRNFPERFEPGIISFDNVGFWLNLVATKNASLETPPKPDQGQKLTPVEPPARTTLEMIARNQILIVRDIDRDVAEHPDVAEFVDIWMTLDALRSVLLKQYPAGPVRLFMLGEIWFEPNTADWKTRLRHFCHYLEILLAIEHE